MNNNQIYVYSTIASAVLPALIYSRYGSYQSYLISLGIVAVIQYFLFKKYRTDNPIDRLASTTSSLTLASIAGAVSTSIAFSKEGRGGTGVLVGFFAVLAALALGTNAADKSS
jgi:asparagine N-glycosylation enzyme membrane subunit Stt3